MDEECLFLVKSLVTEAVALEVLVSGNVEGAKRRGGGRVLEPVVEFDTTPNPIKIPKLNEKKKKDQTHTTAKPKAVSPSP